MSSSLEDYRAKAAARRAAYDADAPAREAAFHASVNRYRDHLQDSGECCQHPSRALLNDGDDWLCRVCGRHWLTLRGEP